METPSAPRLEGLFCHSGSTEETQEQVVVCVVVGISDRDIMEQAAVHSQKVVFMGPQLSNPY